MTSADHLAPKADPPRGKHPARIHERVEPLDLDKAAHTQDDRDVHSGLAHAGREAPAVYPIPDHHDLPAIAGIAEPGQVPAAVLGDRRDQARLGDLGAQ
jgi:hypothetical protein